MGVPPSVKELVDSLPRGSVDLREDHALVKLSAFFRVDERGFLHPESGPMEALAGVAENFWFDSLSFAGGYHVILSDAGSVLHVVVFNDAGRAVVVYLPEGGPARFDAMPLEKLRGRLAEAVVHLHWRDSRVSATVAGLAPRGAVASLKRLLRLSP